MILLGATMIKTEEQLKEDWQCEAKNTERARKDYYNKIIDSVCHCPEPEPIKMIAKLKVRGEGKIEDDKTLSVEEFYMCKLCNGTIPSHKLLANDKKQKVKGGKRNKKL